MQCLWPCDICGPVVWCVCVWPCDICGPVIFVALWCVCGPVIFVALWCLRRCGISCGTAVSHEVDEVFVALYSVCGGNVALDRPQHPPEVTGI